MCVHTFPGLHLVAALCVHTPTSSRAPPSCSVYMPRAIVRSSAKAHSKVTHGYVLPVAQRLRRRTRYHEVPGSSPAAGYRKGYTSATPPFVHALLVCSNPPRVIAGSRLVCSYPHELLKTAIFALCSQLARAEARLESWPGLRAGSALDCWPGLRAGQGWPGLRACWPGLRVCQQTLDRHHRLG